MGYFNEGDVPTQIEYAEKIIPILGTGSMKGYNLRTKKEISFEDAVHNFFEKKDIYCHLKTTEFDSITKIDSYEILIAFYWALIPFQIKTFYTAD